MKLIKFKSEEIDLIKSYYEEYKKKGHLRKLIRDVSGKISFKTIDHKPIPLDEMRFVHSSLNNKAKSNREVNENQFPIPAIKYKQKILDSIDSKLTLKKKELKESQFYSDSKFSLKKDEHFYLKEKIEKFQTRLMFDPHPLDIEIIKKIIQFYGKALGCDFNRINTILTSIGTPISLQTIFRMISERNNEG